MIPLEYVQHLVEVEEDTIRQAAEALGGKNNFQQMLFMGETFRRAGLNPIYLATQDFTSFAVSSTETYDKRLH